MKNFETRALKDIAVYWGTPTPTGDGGRTYDSPVEIKCRWELKQDLFVGMDGKEHVSSAVVYVDRDVALEGSLKLGDLTDLESSTTPEDQTDAFRIRAFSKIKNRTGSKIIRKVWL